MLKVVPEVNEPARTPAGRGQRTSTWFQIDPEQKSVTNRIHIDVDGGGGRGSSLGTRRAQAEAEAARLVPLRGDALQTAVEDGLGHYAVARPTPKATNFDIL